MIAGNDWIRAAKKLPRPIAGQFKERMGFRFYAAQRQDNCRVFLRWELIADDPLLDCAYGRWPL